MTELPPLPTDPNDLNAWVQSLSVDQLRAAMGAIGGGPGQFTPGPRNRPINLPPAPEDPSLVTLTIALRDSAPKIWRRLVIPGELTLDTVHTLFQAAMGWSDSHLHRFLPGAEEGPNAPYFITDFDMQEGDDGTPEAHVRLDQVLRVPGDRMLYLYDFGDGWTHDVTAESFQPGGADPQCLAGEGACPPEDVGGVWAHQELAAWLRAGADSDSVPGHFEDADHAMRWLPAGYDPDAFDPAEATDDMRRWLAGEHLPWHGLPTPLVELVTSLRGPGWQVAVAWMQALGPRTPVVLSEDQLADAARALQALLGVIGSETKLTSAGYLPPAVVREVADAAGITQWWASGFTREDSCPPVANLRAAAQAVGLLRKSRGSLLLTTRALQAMDHPHRLVAGVLERLPLGKDFTSQAGWFALLGLAAGVDGAELHAGMADMLTDRGWRVERTGRIEPRDAAHGAWPTRNALDALIGEVDRQNSTRDSVLARAALFGFEVGDAGER